MNSVLPDPAEMFKGCASQIDKALDVVLDLCCQSKEGATQWMPSVLGLRAWTQQPRHNVQAIFDFFEKMNAFLAEKKHFEELGGNVVARLVHAELQLRLRAFRATHQAARETVQTVSGPAASLQAYSVEVDASMASVWAAVEEKYDHSESCSRIAPCVSPIRIGFWM